MKNLKLLLTQACSWYNLAMLTYTPRPDDTVMVEPDMSLKIRDAEFPNPEFITKNGFYFDNSILKQIELPDGTINFEFRSVCVKDDTAETHYNILGHIHRTNGPDIIEPDGSEYYYLNGQRHRTNGPPLSIPTETKNIGLMGNKSPKRNTIKMNKILKTKSLKRDNF